MNARWAFLLAVGLLPAIASCGVAIRSGGYRPPGVQPSDGLTFAWNQAEDRIGGDPRLHNNRFFEDRLHEAIEWELSLRGIYRDESSPDLLVHHHLALEDHELAQQVVDESGYTTTEVFTFEQGTVVVHVTNAKTKDHVWLAWAQADIEVAMRGPENMRKWVYELAGQMFRTWPVPPRITVDAR